MQALQSGLSIGSLYREKLQESCRKINGIYRKTDATRGEIVDRNGVGLVVNTTKYKIVLNKLYIEEDRLDGILLELADILTKTGDTRTDSLPISVGSDGSCVYKTSREEDAEKLLSSDFLDMDRNTSADDCFDALLKRYKISDRLSLSQKTTLVSIHYNMELENYSNSNPYVFAKNISRSAVNAVSENTQGVSGVEIQTYLTRGASNPDLAPHILGALGSLSEDEYNELKKQGKSYSYDDKIGKFGIELACEDDLKGKGGTRVIQRNADGTLVESIETESAKPGNTVYLTIDSKLQKTAVKSLEENVKAAKQAGKESGQKNNGEDCETGAVVMLSVKDFSVLAAASYPTYDLNRYSEYGSYYVKLSENKNSPMYNRATVGTFACGSVFKPCVAGAALEEKIITDKTKIYCKQDYDFYPTNVVRCMHYHGSLDVTGAIEQSCNYFLPTRAEGSELNRCICMRRNSDWANTRVLKLRNQRELLQAETAQIGRSETQFQPQSVSPTTHLLPFSLQPMLRQSPTTVKGSKHTLLIKLQIMSGRKP